RFMKKKRKGETKKQKIFLTYALPKGIDAPSFAETFPTDGYMKENKTYDNAATETNMDGVYSGTVNAVAEYDVINYIVNAGQYLPADSETVITCLAGSYCPGISGNVQYNQATPQGIQTCPSGYDSSADGSSSNTQCYRACDINNMGANGSISSIAHATAISGNDYYGSGFDTCEPTACENGWHVKAAVPAPNLTSLIGVSEEANGYTSNDSTGEEYDTNNMSNTIIANDPMAFAVDYGNKGIIKGHGRCSTRAGADNTWGGNPYTYNVIDSNFTSTLPDSSGQYCYCQLDSYTPLNGSAIALFAPWVFNNDTDDADGCPLYCAGYCADNLQDDDTTYLAFRAAVFGSVQPSPAMCEANVININWYNADAEDISANNAGTATYGSDVRTPVKAQTIKGKTFKGWRFSKPTQTTTGN
ncbi:MAG: hypothetical protein IJV03_02900, partial [Alphaproteobacteria bacterium]|nr:hypothetical protein [Alphaproteobacteria bacterium]